MTKGGILSLYCHLVSGLSRTKWDWREIYFDKITGPKMVSLCVPKITKIYVNLLVLNTYVKPKNLLFIYFCSMPDRYMYCQCLGGDI